MKYLIVEDEEPAVNRLINMVSSFEPEAELLGVFDTIESTVQWFMEHPEPDLIFLDIHLADGDCFEILKSVNIDAKIVFTTAYDHYAVRAFRFNGLDYLLKPIDHLELKEALSRYRNSAGTQHATYSNLLKAVQLKQEEYPVRFQYKIGKQLKTILLEEVAFFYSEESLTFLQPRTEKPIIIDHSLDQLEQMLNPELFHRVNRKVIIHIQSFVKAESWFNGKLKLMLKPMPDFEVTVSRERSNAFKKWLGI